MYMRCESRYQETVLMVPSPRERYLLSTTVVEKKDSGRAKYREPETSYTNNDESRDQETGTNPRPTESARM